MTQFLHRKKIDFLQSSRRSWEKDAHIKGPEYIAWLEGLGQMVQAPRAPDAPTVISTFAGGGGSSLGYHMAGFNELMAVEWDKDACATLRRNYPHVHVWEGDICTLMAKDVFKITGLKPGELDLFDGSPPCQGFSTAGQRKADDPRNKLFLQFTRLLRDLQPKTMVMENVSGMIKGHMKHTFWEVIRAIQECGYVVEARLLVAAHYGVAQNRERVIFVGVRQDLADQGLLPVHPQPTHVPVPSGHALWGMEGCLNHEEDRQMLFSHNHKSGYKMWELTPPGKNYSHVSGTNTGFSANKINAARPSRTLVKFDENVGTYGTMHYAEKRRLTRAEMKRLAGFPDSYQFADWRSATRQIGNCVPPPLTAAVATCIRDHIIFPSREMDLSVYTGVGDGEQSNSS